MEDRAGFLAGVLGFRGGGLRSAGSQRVQQVGAARSACSRLAQHAGWPCMPAAAQASHRLWPAPAGWRPQVLAPRAGSRAQGALNPEP